MLHRMERGERATAETYSRSAEAYAVHWVPLLAPRHRTLVAGLPLAGATRVLDVGTGVGTMLPVLAHTAPRAVVIGVDASLGMLNRAPSKFPRVVAHAGALPFVDASVDAITCAFVLFHLADPRSALAEMHRALRLGGAIALGTWAGSPSDFPANSEWYALLDDYGATRADDAPSQSSLDTPAKLEAMLEDVGFASVRSESDVSEDRMTLDEFIERRTTIGLSRRRFETVPPDARDELLSEARRRLAALPDGAFVSREEAILTWARRPD
jgi:SAM-dependent methyltransferase